MAATLTPKTTIGTLLKDYPFLLDYLAGYHPEFARLTSPVLRRTVGRLATVEKAAGIAGMPADRLLADIADEVAAQTGQRPEVATRAAAGVDPERQGELKAIIKELHAGATPEEVQPRFTELIEDVEASEIAAMEQALIDEGLPEEEVKRLCDVHVRVFAEALEGHEPLSVPAGHPVDTFQRENRALLQVTQSLRTLADRLGSSPDAAEWGRLKPALASSLDRFAEVERHYLRKENQLFPYLERHGVEGPSKVMWALHDDIRAALKQTRAALDGDEAAAAVTGTIETVTMADDMVTKEEKILFPMAVDALSAEEWAAIRAGEAEIGYAFVAEVPDWPPAGAAASGPAEGGASGPAGVAAGGPAAAVGGPLSLHTGALSLEQIDLMLRALPVDVTFVDEDDEVRFYSEGERVFPRSPGVIGRKVHNCHPPASVHKVKQIVEAFRAGEKDVAEFWLELEGKFLHIRYFAVRDEAGDYRGVVEMVQDVTAIRALEGQRRLLDW